MNDPSRVSGACGWMDGEILPVDEVRLSAFDRTLLYGLGAFETVRLFGGTAYLLDRHMTRLVQSLQAVGLNVPESVGQIAEGLKQLAGANESPDCIARITVTAGTSADAGSADRHVIMALRPVASTQGRVVVGVAEFAHDIRSPLVGVKSTSYLVHYLLRERAEAAGRTDDLMVDTVGHISEATVANVFCVREGRLVTPPLSEGILAGVTRARVLELARELGLEVSEEALHRDDLRIVDECFLTGSGKCLLPVDVLEERALPTARPVADALRDALRKDIAERCDVSEASILF